MSKWSIARSPDSKTIKSLSSNLGISPIVTEILLKRGYEKEEEIDKFLHPDVKNLYHPFLMRDMKRAIERVIEAVKNKEKILIYGDYDVDGVTGTALLVRFLKGIGGDVNYYIPHRIKEGYGLSSEGLRFAKEHYVNLIITVDCGSGSRDLIEEGLRNNLDFVVTDHHESDGRISSLVPFLNPHCDDYPFKELSGCGVAFKLLQGLTERLGLSERELYWDFDLLALATVCDVMPLIGENRIFIKHGMRCIKKSRKKGIKALLKVAGLEGKDINTYHLGYVLGPKINAQGRLKNAEIAVRLFMTDDETEALSIAKKLSCENEKRMKIERRIVKEASSIAEEMKGKYGFVIFGEEWHPGVIGIAASKIADRFYRPTILISLSDGVGRGSGRSIPEFDLFRAMEKCEDLFITFGGHKAACGLNIDPEKIEEFKDRFDKIAEEELKGVELVAKIKIDSELPPGEINPKLMEEIALLKPYGIGNPTPIFLSRELQIVGYPNLIKNEHLKFKIRKQDTVLQAIAFKSKELAGRLDTGSIVDIVYQLTENKYNNQSNIELNIKDVRLSSEEIKE